VKRLVALLALLPACGDGAVCGDGKPEDGEECDDGNRRDDDACSNTCKQRNTLDAQVIWKILGSELPGFEENCPGVEAQRIRLEITGPDSRSEEVDCSFGQRSYTVLPPGDYTVKGTLYDGAGQPLTRGLATTSFTIENADVQAQLDFAMEDFLRDDYVGNWMYKFMWNGVLTCAGASPPVAATTIRLERDGEPLVDGKGVPVDGTTPLECYDVSEIAESVVGLPWGHATLTVTGLDADGVEQFREEFPTFVGAGASNAVFTYDVNSVLPDAGPPDAGPADPADAGPPDAAVADAGA
jgi:cysteine-rich repeat protein